MPPYLGILVVVGMDMDGIVMASASQTIALLILGAPYGRWLGFVRRKLVSETEMMMAAAA